MSQPKVNIAELRQRAEEYLQNNRERSASLEAELGGLQLDSNPNADNVHRLLEELHVYQAELAIQNQHLLDAQADVVRNLERYRSLFENLPLPALLVDEHGVVSEVNQAGEQLFGFSTHSNLNHSALSRLFHSASQGALHGLMRRLHTKATPQRMHSVPRLQLRSADNRVRWVDVFAMGLAEDEITPSGSLLILLDRTAELSLEETEQRFRALADSAPVIVWITEEDQEIRWFNKGWSDFTGHGPEQDLAGGWLNAVHPDDRPRCQKQLKEAYRTGQGFSNGLRLRRRDGQYRWMFNSSQPRYSLHGELLGFTGVCVDYSERQELLDRLEKIASHVQGMIYQFQLWPDGRSAFPYVSKGIRNIYGFEPEQVCKDASPAFARIHPDDLERIQDSINRSAEALCLWHESWRVNLAEGRM
ncbi:MAG: PAS domain S-box protein, partial [Gammaproteobacteria bacterium]|nr:PAS domain S-box protein [Gammaproteobacteria bacterium]